LQGESASNGHNLPTAPNAFMHDWSATFKTLSTLLASSAVKAGNQCEVVGFLP
jgi:hypothetical protein